MDKYKTMLDFPGEGIIPVLSAIVTAVPPFFSIMLFFFWMFGTGSSYYVILKTTGKKRFWHSLTAMSFSMFIVSLMVASMNTTTVTFLSGYWVGFYVLMIMGSFFAMSYYK